MDFSLARRSPVLLFSVLISASVSWGQASPPSTGSTSDPIDRHAFGILSNYRTANYSDPFTAIATKQKFNIAAKDSFDFPVFLLAGAFAGLSQLQDTHPRFGQGAEGFGHRYITSLGDQTIANFMTEGVFPSMFHQDPRYFRQGSQYGSTSKRAVYSATRIFVTRNDSGKWAFNFSELLGVIAASGVANAYYPGERTWGDNAERVGVKLGTDALSFMLKEFWPDIKQKMSKHPKTTKK